MAVRNWSNTFASLSKLDAVSLLVDGKVVKSSYNSGVKDNTFREDWVRYKSIGGATSRVSL